MKQAYLSTPILFIIYNRPDQTLKIFEEIKKAYPAKIYIAANGPIKSNAIDAGLCRQTRSVVNKINWDCSLNTNFLEHKIDYKYHVSSAINWFFSNEEEGIILEDDCFPDKSFFYYCTLLLHTYRYDESVGHIGGNNILKPPLKNYNYFFSKHAFNLGWATWRRAWKLFDLSISSLPETLSNDSFRHYFQSKNQKYALYNFFLEAYNNTDTWYNQWLYALWKNNLKSIVPPVNLVQNINPDKRSRYLKRVLSESNYRAETINEIVSPHSKEFINDIDNTFFRIMYNKGFLSNIYLRCKVTLFMKKYHFQLRPKNQSLTYPYALRQ